MLYLSDQYKRIIAIILKGNAKGINGQKNTVSYKVFMALQYFSDNLQGNPSNTFFTSSFFGKSVCSSSFSLILTSLLYFLLL